MSDTKTFTVVVNGNVSELKVTSLVLSSEGTAPIEWEATPGKTYRLLSKNKLDAPEWSLVGEMIATSKTGVLEDKATAGISQRFYRVERED